jgi:hypothetical protein
MAFVRMLDDRWARHIPSPRHLSGDNAVAVAPVKRTQARFTALAKAGAGRLTRGPPGHGVSAPTSFNERS